jgi:putative membrane protein
MLQFFASQVFRGFLMGSADVVPGVSGGTVALVLGIYERLVATVRQGAAVLPPLARLDSKQAWNRFKAIDWKFIVPLLVGVLSAIAILAGPLTHLLEERPIEMAAAFFGLVVASILIASESLKSRDGVRLGVLVLSAVATFWVLGFRTGEESDPQLWWIFLAGAIAICAMILPGISGSFILLMLGLYDYVLGAVDDRDLLIIVVFGAGCIAGLASFSSLLHALLKRHHDTVLAALIGLMAGSLRVLWPWPGGVDSTDLGRPPGEDLPIALLLGIGAAVLAIVLVRFSGSLPKR